MSLVVAEAAHGLLVMVLLAALVDLAVVVEVFLVVLLQLMVLVVFKTLVVVEVDQVILKVHQTTVNLEVLVSSSSHIPPDK
jgi:hypothetical protein